MKTMYWLSISCLMGVLIAFFGKNCFLLLMAVTWCGGGILYFLCYFYWQLIRMRQNKSSTNDPKSRYSASEAYCKRMVTLEKWARILMYLGCIAIIEAIIIL